MTAKHLDLRTPLQREKDERNKKIHQEYKEILENPPENFTKWAIWRAIGEKYGLQAQGVRVIISKMEQHSKSEKDGKL
ncbi:hypothetical protein [Vaginella massiliensis]|uniref:hypothetical protein n=1 Tax=Vaginella massiliensis TaxID=1816680 RepID=UPI000839A087|nr:hypothetical protein [Vaginella massiliensis]